MRVHESPIYQCKVKVDSLIPYESGQPENPLEILQPTNFADLPHLQAGFARHATQQTSIWWPGPERYQTADMPLFDTSLLEGNDVYLHEIRTQTV